MRACRPLWRALWPSASALGIPVSGHFRPSQTETFRERWRRCSRDASEGFYCTVSWIAVERVVEPDVAFTTTV
jgi:hypothetical protein